MSIYAQKKDFFIILKCDKKFAQNQQERQKLKKAYFVDYAASRERIPNNWKNWNKDFEMVCLRQIRPIKSKKAEKKIRKVALQQESKTL